MIRRICFSFFILTFVSAAQAQMKYYTPNDIDWENIFDDASYKKHYDAVNADSVSFIERFFLPWNLAFDSICTDVQSSGMFFHYTGVVGSAYRPCYAGNYDTFPDELIQHLNHNIDERNFPNTLRYGLITENTNIRLMPTDELCLDEPFTAGEGYPFDYYQSSSLWIGTPIQVLHHSTDRRWYLISSVYCNGWIKADDFGFVDESIRRSLASSQFVSILKDRTAILSQSSHHSISAFIGMVLPMASVDNEPLRVLLPNFTRDTKMIYFEPSDPIASELATPFPIPFKATTVQALISELLHTQYSWGGLNISGRDCSATLKDLFIPFGVWLPRNSKEQVSTGMNTLFEEDIDQKLDTLREKGIPLLTLLYKPGHIMLYLGDQNSESKMLMFHNVWGIKPTFSNSLIVQLEQQQEVYNIFGINVYDPNKEPPVPGKTSIETRMIIGKAAITKLELEEDLDELKAKGANFHPTFMEHMTEFTIIK
jgi:hypothetical protein